jgi:gamma-glutamyltranspeptidase/glutathione hydrolase
MKKALILKAAILLTIVAIWPAWSASPKPAVARHGMVVSSESIAADIGLEILKSGGNAVDAAVATCIALNVTEGYNSGMGGGCFVLIYKVETGEVFAVDGRERAPINARRDLFVDPDDHTIIKGLSTEGSTAVATPGQPAALQLIHSRWGSLPWVDLFQPAIALADTGFVLSRTYGGVLSGSKDRLSRYPSSREIFFPPGDTIPYGFRDRLIQKDLARFLDSLSRNGADWFYSSRFSDDLAGFVTGNGGYLTTEDLLSYEARLREPIHGRFRGYDIYSMPPPSSGGVHVVQILKMLEPFDLADLGAGSSQSIHLMAEAMKRAFADRAYYLGDPDYVDVPVQALLDSLYLANHSRSIEPDRAADIASHGKLPPEESSETTHFSVIDSDGNMVAFTASLNTSFGSALVLPGWGLLLNNHMDDFSIQPGVPNYYGLIGSEANAIEPGKRPLSSMSPTIVLREGKPAGVFGSPGGPRIITTVVQTFLNVVVFGMDIQAAVDFPRVHHQWKPNRIYVEPEIPKDVILNLESKGHEVIRRARWSSAQCIWINSTTGLIMGGTDSRSEGKAAGY